MATETDLDEAAEAGQVELSGERAFQLGSLEVRPSILMVTCADGRQAALEPRVMQVLVALHDAGGDVVTRQMLVMRCWEGRAVSEDAINRCVQRLRRLAEETGAFTIETVPRVGYRLAAEPEPTQGPGPRCRCASVCVLPFANMSDDPQQGYFSDGITEDIITDLSKVKSLFVVARTTAFAIRDKGLSVPEIAAQLGVTHVLEGSVRKSQGQLRITAQLIDGETGGHVWAERYDREVKDVFALQDELAKAVVHALKLKLLPGEAQGLQQRGTSNLTAYELYLTARRMYLRGEQCENKNLAAIIGLCERATDIDPDFAKAWVLMGFAQNSLREIEPSIAADGGVAAVQKALALDPSSADAHALHARHLWLVNLVEEALAEADVALKLDPQAWAAHWVAATINYGLRRFETAIVHYEKAIATPESASGDAGMLMSSYHAVGDHEGVLRAARIVLERAEKALARDDVNAFARSCGASALAALGREAQARDMMERGVLLDPDNIKMRYNFACALVRHLDDREAALEMLTPIFPRFNAKWLRHARTDPDFDPLRSDPRFQAMMTEAETRVRQAGEID